MRTFVPSCLDWCSRLWILYRVKLEAELVEIQRHNIKKYYLVNIDKLLERLKKLKLYSLEKRCERYAVIRTWKISEDLVPNFVIETLPNHRKWLHCIILKIQSPPFRIRIQYCNSLDFKRLQPVNILLSSLRDLQGVDIEVFKEQLDKF